MAAEMFRRWKGMGEDEQAKWIDEIANAIESLEERVKKIEKAQSETKEQKP